MLERVHLAPPNAGEQLEVHDLAIRQAVLYEPRMSEHLFVSIQ
ncbi:MAG TPA: hypothetical protein VIG42_07530 [Solirubrobacteraceae bacterium]